VIKASTVEETKRIVIFVGEIFLLLPILLFDTQKWYLIHADVSRHQSIWNSFIATNFPAAPKRQKITDGTSTAAV
jgi:hypothetical protein